VGKGPRFLGVTGAISATGGGTHFSIERDSKSNQLDRGVCAKVKQVVKLTSLREGGNEISRDTRWAGR